MIGNQPRDSTGLSYVTVPEPISLDSRLFQIDRSSSRWFINLQFFTSTYKVKNLAVHTYFDRLLRPSLPFHHLLAIVGDWFDWSAQPVTAQRLGVSPSGEVCFGNSEWLMICASNCRIVLTVSGRWGCFTTDSVWTAWIGCFLRSTQVSFAWVGQLTNMVAILALGSS